MAVLGINTWGERSSACLITDNNQISALCGLHSSAFCANAFNTLKPTYETIHTVVTHAHSVHAVKRALPAGTCVQMVDYCDALSMATIASTDWDSCAILLCDDYYTRLGYFANNCVYWIREFTYPNSLALFSASAARFVGHAAVNSEQAITLLSEQGRDVYTAWIKKHVLAIHDGSYQLLHNAERGFGVATASADVAASVSSVVSETVVNMAQWLKKHVDSSRLAVVGRIAANGISNTAIAQLSGYEHVACISMHGAAATAVGAAALIQRPLLEHAYIGPETSTTACEQTASALLRGDNVAHGGCTEFSTVSAVNNCLLTLPYAPKLRAINKPYHVICQDRDYHSWFEGKHIPYFGQYRVAVKNRQMLDAPYATVVAVSKNKNSHINRVLEITRAQGYPVIVSTPLI